MLPHTGDQARSVEQQRKDGRPSVSRPYLSGGPLTLVGIKRRDQVAGSDSAYFVAVQQQLARDLEVERAAMGQRCRPQSFGEVQRGNPQPRRWLDFL